MAKSTGGIKPVSGVMFSNTPEKYPTSLVAQSSGTRKVADIISKAADPNAFSGEIAKEFKALSVEVGKMMEKTAKDNKRLSDSAASNAFFEEQSKEYGDFNAGLAGLEGAAAVDYVASNKLSSTYQSRLARVRSAGLDTEAQVAVENRLTASYLAEMASINYQSAKEHKKAQVGVLTTGVSRQSSLISKESNGTLGYNDWEARVCSNQERLVSDLGGMDAIRPSLRKMYESDYLKSRYENVVSVALASPQHSVDILFAGSDEFADVASNKENGTEYSKAMAYSNQLKESAMRFKTNQDAANLKAAEREIGMRLIEIEDHTETIVDRAIQAAAFGNGENNFQYEVMSMQDAAAELNERAKQIGISLPQFKELREINTRIMSAQLLTNPNVLNIFKQLGQHSPDEMRNAVLYQLYQAGSELKFDTTGMDFRRAVENVENHFNGIIDAYDKDPHKAAGHIMATSGATYGQAYEAVTGGKTTMWQDENTRNVVLSGLNSDDPKVSAGAWASLFPRIQTTEQKKAFALEELGLDLSDEVAAEVFRTPKTSKAVWDVIKNGKTYEDAGLNDDQIDSVSNLMGKYVSHRGDTYYQLWFGAGPANPNGEKALAIAFAASNKDEIGGFYDIFSSKHNGMMMGVGAGMTKNRGFNPVGETRKFLFNRSRVDIVVDKATNERINNADLSALNSDDGIKALMAVQMGQKGIDPASVMNYLTSNPKEAGKVMSAMGFKIIPLGDDKVGIARSGSIGYVPMDKVSKELKDIADSISAMLVDYSRSSSTRVMMNKDKVSLVVSSEDDTYNIPFLNRSYTFEELNEQAKQVKSMLMQSGVREGQYQMKLNRMQQEEAEELARGAELEALENGPRWKYDRDKSKYELKYDRDKLKYERPFPNTFWSD